MGDRRIKNNHSRSTIGRRTDCSEFKTISGESKRRSTVAVGGVLRDRRKNSSAQIHLGLVNVGVLRTGLDGIKDRLQLIADEHGDDSRRRLVRAQTVIVACGCNRDAEQILILVNSLDNSGQEQDELGVLARVLARLEQVLARSVEMDQLLCFPEPFTPSNGFSCSRQVKPCFSRRYA